ncbi:SOS response-associated peptidase [Methylotenera versatilis]|uniref:SOS response-associated peptidase n=1 Tax=Methylotenera versatilis TaxID=1055487 RepID=UPI000645A756|nr:SOS response-associated peptidase family protein [Methylotenera versatilis]
MCSNFQPIKNHHADWVKKHFDCELPNEEWRDETYPTYSAPFVYLDDGKPRCELAQFGLVPHWAPDKKKYGLRTYNARSETVHEKPSYREAWKERRFGLVLMESFYEPSWETGKAVRWRIRRSDGQPSAAASIWERIIDKETGEVIFSFSMLTINADGHEVMKHFHRPEDEKRSIVVLNDSDYMGWLFSSNHKANNLLKLTPKHFLLSEPAPQK